ncbi:hypothetical protein JCM8547_008311 [Rhodosporidiobolus lusitaniae]
MRGISSGMYREGVRRGRPLGCASPSSPDSSKEARVDAGVVEQHALSRASTEYRAPSNLWYYNASGRAIDHSLVSTDGNGTFWETSRGRAAAVVAYTPDYQQRTPPTHLWYYTYPGQAIDPSLVSTDGNGVFWETAKGRGYPVEAYTADTYERGIGKWSAIAAYVNAQLGTDYNARQCSGYLRHIERYEPRGRQEGSSTQHVLNPASPEHPAPSNLWYYDSAGNAIDHTLVSTDGIGSFWESSKGRTAAVDAYTPDYQQPEVITDEHTRLKRKLETMLGEVVAPGRGGSEDGPRISATTATYS